MSTELNTYLTFKVGNHFFGVDVSKVLEISEYKKPQPVPDSPAYMSGVVEFREQVIPLIDCGLKFNLPAIDITEVTCMVALEVYNEELGKKFNAAIVVDAVSDVFEANNAEKLSMEDDFKPGYVLASYKTDKGLVIVLDADKVFSDKDIIAIDAIMGR
ncbi:MAG: chemotaxis protein CheW [Breznakibacter sp.]